MGREIRRVPPNWEHPIDAYGRKRRMYKQTFRDAAKVLAI